MSLQVALFLRTKAEEVLKIPVFEKKEISYARASLFSKANCDRLCSLTKFAESQNIYHGIRSVIYSTILNWKKAWLSERDIFRRLFFFPARNPDCHERRNNLFFFFFHFFTYVSCKALCKPSPRVVHDDSNLFLTHSSHAVLLPKGPYFPIIQAHSYKKFSYK